MAEGREALQEILRLYNFTGSTYADEADRRASSDLTSRPHFARVVSETASPFARGTQVDMEFDEEQFVGGGAYLFASVLEAFSGVVCFAEQLQPTGVRTRQRKEVLKQWPPRAGQKILL